MLLVPLPVLLGEIATALTAGRAGATVGLIAGPVVGDAFDDAMVDQLHCLHCGYTFIQS